MITNINIYVVKYIPFIIIGIAFFYAIYKIITTDHLLSFVKKSLCEENGKPSGRSIAGFFCINALISGFLISIYYAKDHCPPEWYAWMLAMLVTGFYGLKELGKFAISKGGPVDTLPTPPPAPVTPSPVAQNNNNNNNEQKTERKDEEIG